MVKPVGPVSPPTGPVLLIDSSYFNFYRFYATISWYRRSPDRVEEAEGVAWLDNPIFMATYEKMWFETITKLCRKFKAQTKNILFARDGAKVWRYALYPKYKANRSMLGPDDPHSPGPVFKHTNEHFHPRVSESAVMRNERAEGDDIIAVATNYIKTIRPNPRIIIITGDHDLLQLSEPTVVEIYQLKGFKELTVDNPHVMLLTKILGGDSSDNIPAAFKGCGKVTAKRLANDPEELDKVLAVKGRKQFELNQRLIDFDFIPKNIVREIETELDTIF